MYAKHARSNVSNRRDHSGVNGRCRLDARSKLRKLAGGRIQAPPFRQAAGVVALDERLVSDSCPIGSDPLLAIGFQLRPSTPNVDAAVWTYLAAWESSPPSRSCFLPFDHL